MSTTARVVFTIAPLFIGCVLFPAPLAAPGYGVDSIVETSFQSSTTHTSGVVTHSATGELEEWGAEAEGVFDLYGNEVTDAVTTYKLDEEGSLYEVHSPQTALPELGSPES